MVELFNSTIFIYYLIFFKASTTVEIASLNGISTFSIVLLSLNSQTSSPARRPTVMIYGIPINSQSLNLNPGFASRSSNITSALAARSSL